MPIPSRTARRHTAPRAREGTFPRCAPHLHAVHRRLAEGAVRVDRHHLIVWPPITTWSYDLGATRQSVAAIRTGSVIGIVKRAHGVLTKHSTAPGVPLSSVAYPHGTREWYSFCT